LSNHLELRDVSVRNCSSGNASMSVKYSNRVSRRGVLLLLVLSSLTLFMMLGAIMLVLATRARTASRAFAAASNTVSRDEVLLREALDESLMVLLRGTAVGSPLSDSILGDRFGSGTSIGTWSGPLSNTRTISLPISGLPSTYVGRVLTLAARPPAPSVSRSFIIKEIKSSPDTCIVYNYSSSQPASPTVSGTFDIYLNGRDFGNETWDAPDNDNAFLTRATLSGSQMVVHRAAFGAEGQPCTVDNDSDGVADGVWLSGDNWLPDQSTINGRTVSLRVSYLVLDLDGRLNVNAHGQKVPVQGIGPASVDGSSVLAGGVWDCIRSGTGVQVQTCSSLDDQGRPTPSLGYTMEGRFGRSTITNSYGIRLDLRGSRLGVASLGSERGIGPVASVFTPAELERVLRVFDRDASALPPRLSAMLGEDSKRARLLLTTDSWDSLSISGTMVDNIAVSAMGMLPADVREGRRVNLNTLCDSPSDFGSLRALLDECQITGSTGAQWAANILEFYDPDQAAGQYAYTPPGATMPVQVAGYDTANYELFGGNSMRFNSVAQLLAVPKDNQQGVEDKGFLQCESGANEKFLEAVCVSSGTDKMGEYKWCRYEASIEANPWREPGRINVNTCGNDVYKVLIESSGPNPNITAAKSLYAALKKLPTDPTEKIEKYQAVVTAANRLANIATVRSNVFAVWITVEMADSAVPDKSKRYRRLFAIVDRSIPVGYYPGLNLNARDAVRLIRYLD
jgi:hypothetical protein